MPSERRLFGAKPAWAESRVWAEPSDRQQLAVRKRLVSSATTGEYFPSGRQLGQNAAQQEILDRGHPHSAQFPLKPALQGRHIHVHTFGTPKITSA
jgi:hypothetical protein